MDLYAIALFIHFVGLIVLFSAFVLHARGDRQLRRATSMEQAHVCIMLLKASGPMFPVGSMLLLLSGLYMSQPRWSFSTPWVTVGIAGVIAMSVIGGIVGGRHGGALKVYADQTRGPIPPELALVIRQRGPQITSLALGGAALGIVWIMAAKSNWTASIAVILTAAILGALAGERWTSLPSLRPDRESSRQGIGGTREPSI